MVSWALVAGGLAALAGCGGKGGASLGPDGGARDARSEARSGGGGDASSDARGKDGGASFDASAPDVGGPCMGASGCSVTEICCASVLAHTAGGGCVAGSKCPSGEFEPCGVNGGEACHAGKCAPYECTFKVTRATSDLYACEIPMIQGFTCARAPDSGFPQTPDAGDGGP